MAAADAADAVDCKVQDQGNGSYELLWACQRAGTFPIDLTIGGVHVVGSPMKLTVAPAQPAVERFNVTGVGLVKAVAGEQAEPTVVADRGGGVLGFAEGLEAEAHGWREVRGLWR